MSARGEAVDSDTLGALLNRVAQRDQDAFAQLYDATHSRVYGMTLRVLRDSGYAEECVQEVFLHVWRRASAYDPEKGSATAWLITLAHRRAIDRVRAEQAASDRNSIYGAIATSAPSDDVADAVARRGELQAVTDCLDTLTTIQRSSIDLAYYGGLTYTQVAERLHVALPTIKSRMRDALTRLRRCLNGPNHD